jgi:hypothetical protein
VSTGEKGGSEIVNKLIVRQESEVTILCRLAEFLSILWADAKFGGITVAE